MDFLNQTFSQIVELFRSMTPAARLTSGLLMAAVVVSLGYLFAYKTADADMYLMHGHAFPSSDLPKVQAALGTAGLNGFEVDGNMIRVPRSQHAAYIAALADAGALPLNYGEYLLNTIAETGRFSTSEERDVRLNVARQQVLANVIREWSGIEAAAVLIDSRKQRDFKGTTITTASVSVQPVGNDGLADDRVRSIRAFVSGAVAGLQPEHVTIIDSSTGRSYVGDSEGLGSGLEDAYFTRMQSYQDSYRSQIISAFGGSIPGVSVSVNVELDRQRRRTEGEVKVDPNTVAITERNTSLSSTNESAAPGGRPGVAAQQPNQPAQLAGGGNNGTRSVEQQDDSETQSIVSHVEAKTEFQGLTPNKVTVAVTVPSSYFERIWYELNPTPEGEEPRHPEASDLALIEQTEIPKIRSVVASVIPHEEGVDPDSFISVTSFRSLKAPAIPEPSYQVWIVEWLSRYWSTIGMMVLVLFSLVMLRSMIRSASNNTAMPSIPLTIPVSDDSEAKPAQPSKRRLEIKPSLNDELAEMVRENPDTAANILRNWIGNAN